MKKTIFIITFLLIFSASGLVWADSETINPDLNLTNSYYHLNIDKATLSKGYTVSAFAEEIKLSLTPGTLLEATEVEVAQLNEGMDTPWSLDKISKIYQFEFKNKEAYNNHHPFYIQFAYEAADNNYKQVYFYDKNFSAWRPLPTWDYPEEKFVRSLIHLPYARIAVFSYPQILTMGQASWYKYKGGNFAASPDFPRGSRLRVYNLANDKFVDVEVNDYGPDRSIHPRRAVDLDSVAFKSIASLGEGVIDVKVEPLYIAPEEGRILGISAAGARSQPAVTVKAAIVMDEVSGEVFWEKDADAVLPLASLTKLVAIKTFLDLEPSLNEQVVYSLRDEEYNYQYCEKWESARLNLEEGEVLTIEDLIYASLVGSANNTVETLVRVSGLARDEFISQMNENVKTWGTLNTNFIEPTGLSPDNVSSARDYAIITKEVLANPIIRKASTQAEYKFTTIKNKKSLRLRNTNSLVHSASFDITGSKTGYLHEAGYCLMSRAQAQTGSQIIVVTMGAESKQASEDETTDLLLYGIRQIGD